MPAAARHPYDLGARWEKIARGNRRALLKAEAAALALLHTSAAAATDHVVRAVESEPHSPHAKSSAIRAVTAAATTLRAAVVDNVRRGRRLARDASLERLGVQLEAGWPGVDAPLPSHAEEDIGHAESVADAFTAAWRTALLASVLRWAKGAPTELAEPVGQVLRDAAEAQHHRLRRIAATEIPHAYTVEHGEAVRAIRPELYRQLNEQRLRTASGHVVPPWSPRAGAAPPVAANDIEFQRRYAFGNELTRAERLRRALREGPRGREQALADSAQRMPGAPAKAPATSAAPGASGSPGAAAPGARSTPGVAPATSPLAVTPAGAPGAMPDGKPAAKPGAPPAPADPTGDLDFVGMPVERWDGVLDSAICPICRSLDGTYAFPGKGFPSGYVPGYVHPHCRCIPEFVPLTRQMVIFQRARHKMGVAYKPNLADVKGARAHVDPKRKAP